MITPAVDALAPLVGTATACALLGRARASHYRAKRAPKLGPKPRRPAPANALTDDERAHVLATLTSDRFVDKSGEYYLNVLLKQGTEVADAAAGWGGDLFSLYRDGERRLLLWESQWDTPADASRFHADFRRFLERGFGVDFRDGGGKDRPFIAGHSPAGYFFLLRDGARLFYARGSDREGINELISGGIYD